MTFNWKLWAKGLLAAAIGGATTAATNAITDPAALGKPKELGGAAGVGAALGALMYLKTHPPGSDDAAAAPASPAAPAA